MQLGDASQVLGKVLRWRKMEDGSPPTIAALLNILRPTETLIQKCREISASVAGWLKAK